jgi:hypothetical protein
MMVGVGIRKDIPVTGGIADGMSQGIAFADPAGGSVFTFDKFDTAILSSQLGNDVAGTVGGSVIDDDNLKIGIILRLQGLNAASNLAFFVTGGHDHTDKRKVGGFLLDFSTGLSSR